MILDNMPGIKNENALATSSLVDFLYEKENIKRLFNNADCVLDPETRGAVLINLHSKKKKALEMIESNSEKEDEWLKPAVKHRSHQRGFG
jgi:hypothetical protein